MLRPVSVAYDMRKNMFLSWFALVFACPFDSEYCLPTLSQMPARERERERERQREGVEKEVCSKASQKPHIAAC